MSRPPTRRPSRRRTAPRRPRVGLTATLLAAALVASACQWPPDIADDPTLMATLGAGSLQGTSPGRVPDDNGGGSGGVPAARVYVEARARLATGGAVEIGARVNATDVSWQPEERLFDYPDATVGDWWTSTPIGLEDSGISAARIRVRRLTGGNIELAILTAAGRDVRPREPRLAYADLATDDWTYATPVVLTAAGEPAPAPPQVDVGPDGYTSIDVGAACGLRGDGTIHCWGSGVPPDGTFTTLSGNCGIRFEGDVACWWRDRQMQTPVGPFVAISEGGDACGIRPEGRVECWRTHPFAWWDDLRPPGGVFTAVSVGGRHACGLRIDGTVDCWGSNDVRVFSGSEVHASEHFSGQARPPSGMFSVIAAGYEHTCGIHSGGTVACWGDDYYGQSSPPAGAFSALSAGRDFTCGLRPGGAAECWGGQTPIDSWPEFIPPTHPQHDPPPPPAGAFTSISAGGGSACGLRPDGTMVCWRAEDPAASPYGPVRFNFDAKEDSFSRWRHTYAVTHVPGGTFSEFAVGGRHACGLRTDNTVACWGADTHGQGDPPADRFTALSAGGYHTCALSADSVAACWGHDRHRQADPPDGTFTALSAGWEHTCALDADGGAVCWGDNRHGQADPPAGTFTDLDAGGWHTCAIGTDRSAACWGDDSHAQTAAPPGAYVSLTAGALHTCALRPDNTAACWGDDRHGQTDPPDGTFEALHAGADYTCGLRPGGDTDCWGADWSYSSLREGVLHIDRPPAGPPPEGPFSALTAGSQIACGLRPDGTGECWIATGRRDIDRHARTSAIEPDGAYTAIGVGATHTCAIDTGGNIACWGDHTHAQATPPPGAYETLSVGGRHTCAIDTANHVACWGENTFGQTRAPPGAYRTVTTGTHHTCAIRTGGRLTCWGDNTYGQATPPAGTYTDIDAGERHTCAIRTTGRLACWGDNTLDQADPPPGTYRAVSAGKLHTCALHAGGRIDCWGLGYDHDDTNPHDNEDPTTPPPGPFTALSVGERHTCAIDTTGDVACWPQYGGRGGYAGGMYLPTFYYWNTWRDHRATPPPGPFTAISAGTRRTCGIRPDQTIDCWTANEPLNQ